MMKKNRILVIAGPTAVGKTEYSVDFAKAFNGEIVSCDSMQLYKYMDIGSAKPNLDERKQAVHQGLGARQPGRRLCDVGNDRGGQTPALTAEIAKC